MNRPTLLLALVLSLAAFPRVQALPLQPEVQLMREGDKLQPTSTLEFRFSREMVSKDELGVPLANSPVVLEPALPGSFTWLSRRSGVYVPWEAPQMGVTYHIALQPD